MAYRDAVKYIEEMRPDYVHIVGEECVRTRGIIGTALSTLDGLPGKVQWASDAADLYRQRLRETIDLAEGLYAGFEKAGKAITDYAQEQTRAKARVADGITAEARLRVLIEPIVVTQSVVVRLSDALRQWHDLRSTTGITDFLIELPVSKQIDEVRHEADRLWDQATSAYDEAIRIESTARADAVAELTAAYRQLPDFLADSSLSEKIVQKTPGLLDTEGRYHIGPPTKPSLAFDDDFPYDPNATATPTDYASWTEWNAKLRGGQLLRADLDDATDAYAHYLEGTGTDMRVDYEEAYREDPDIRKTVDSEILSAQREAERIYRESGQTAFQMTGQPSAAEYPSTENWQKTLGSHQVYGTSEVIVNGDQITMKIKVHAEDMYNFNAGAADIATGAPDDENGRFATLGWAKGFATHGEIERTVTWTIGEPPGEVSSSGAPERQAPGEDRGDGRQDG